MTLLLLAGVAFLVLTVPVIGFMAVVLGSCERTMRMAENWREKWPDSGGEAAQPLLRVVDDYQDALLRPAVASCQPEHELVRPLSEERRER